MLRPVLGQPGLFSLGEVPGCSVRVASRTKKEVVFGATCDGEPAGQLVLARRDNIDGMPGVFWPVLDVHVREQHQRKGVATALYEHAAKYLCRNKLGPLVSTSRMMEAKSVDFWKKQERKGRAKRIKQPRLYLGRARGDNMDIFVLDPCEHRDLSGLPTPSRNTLFAVGGVVALALLLSRSRLPALTVTEARKQFGAVLDVAAERFSVPAGLVRAVAYVESRWNPTAGSGKGAVGLMQLMPQTAQNLGVTDRTNPEQNANGGAKFLAQLYARAGSWPVALAAYNWGPGYVFGSSTRSPSTSESQWPAATQTYVRDVMQAWERGVV